MTRNLEKQFRGKILSVSTLRKPVRSQPEDLDLVFMARSALNYLRGNPDPERNYECKFSLGPLGIPCHVPYLASTKEAFDPISLADTDARMLWQYPHMRRMTGEDEPEQVELGIRRRIKSYQRDDYLIWANPASGVGQMDYLDEDWSSPWASAMWMCFLAEEYESAKDKSIAAAARKILLALKSLAHWDGKRAYYPGGPMSVKNGVWLDKGWAQTLRHNYPFIVEPCVRYYECTGDQEGLELAVAFAEGFIAGSQPDMGEARIDPETGAFKQHVHLHTHAIWGVAHLGAILNEPRYSQWAKKAYDFVLANGTDYGWYPEFIPQEVEYRTEICVVGGMVAMGRWLAQGGLPEYWDHVERTVRNELRQAQFFLTPEFLNLFYEVNKDKSEEVVARAIAELRKLEGGFVAQPGFDDWVGYITDTIGKPGMMVNGIQMMGCCPPEGMRGIWEAWNGVVQENGNDVYVNMSLNRDHPAARVTAYRPADGQLKVEARRQATFYLRPPAWADKEGVALERNGKSFGISWGGPASAYAVCRDVGPGEIILLSWPVPRFRQEFTPISIPGRVTPVTVYWVGNEVTSVEPHGQYLPMFGRE